MPVTQGGRSDQVGIPSHLLLGRFFLSSVTSGTGENIMTNEFDELQEILDFLKDHGVSDPLRRVELLTEIMKEWKRNT